MSRHGVRSARARALKDRLFVAVCLGATALAVLVLTVLLAAIVRQGWTYLDADFLATFPSRRPADAGFKAALWGSVWTCAVAAVAAIPLGVATAVFLEEYQPRRPWLRRMHAFVQLNISNLAGVPSIVYGILGLTVFVRMFGLFGSPNFSVYDEMLRVRLDGRPVLASIAEYGERESVLESPLHGRFALPAAEVEAARRVHVRRHVFELRDGRTIRGGLLGRADPPAAPATLTVEDPDGRAQTFRVADVAAYRTNNALEWGDPESLFYFRLPLGASVLAAGLTLALVILPIVIIASREALRAVPPSLREGAFAVGATRWQVIWRMVLPAAVPGIMTGSILAISRAIGEAAPLLVIGGSLFVLFTPQNLMSDFAAMPLQIFNWTSRPQPEFHRVAASGIVVLLAVLLAFNAVAIVLRQRFQRPLQ